MLIVRHPHSYGPERAYAHDVVLTDFLGLEWTGVPEARGDVEITMEGSDGHISLPDVLFQTSGDDWLKESSLPQLPLTSWSARDDPRGEHDGVSTLPIIYGARHADGPCEDVPESSSRLALDVFGSVFFLLTRYEEIVCTRRDAHSRFPAEASIADREGFLERPLANEYVELLWHALSRLWPRLTRRQRRFREFLTHDVDSPLLSASSAYRILKAASGDVLRRHDPDLAFNTLLGLAARVLDRPKLDPYSSFDEIMDHSERAGLRSAFYFMAGATDARFDGHYSLADPWIRKLIKRIHDRGHEIGLHPSYETFRDPLQLRREFDALIDACSSLGVSQVEWGGRQHFLRWENPTTWRAWAEAGLAYDSSLGFSDRTGFRSGVCYEYPTFDLLAKERLELRERPLIVMEMSLLDADQSTAQSTVERIDELRRACRRFDGDFTLLWHNSRLASRRERSVYRAAVAETSCAPREGVEPGRSR